MFWHTDTQACKYEQTQPETKTRTETEARQHGHIENERLLSPRLTTVSMSYLVLASQSEIPVKYFPRNLNLQQSNFRKMGSQAGGRNPLAGATGEGPSRQGGRRGGSGAVLWATGGTIHFSWYKLMSQGRYRVRETQAVIRWRLMKCDPGKWRRGKERKGEKGEKLRMKDLGAR